MQLFHFFFFLFFFLISVFDRPSRHFSCSRVHSDRFALAKSTFCFRINTILFLSFIHFTAMFNLLVWKILFFFFSFLRYLILVTFRFYDNFFDDTFSLNRRYYSYIGGVDSKKKSWLWRASLLHQGSFEYTFEVFPLLLTILTILRYNGRCFRN